MMTSQDTIYDVSLHDIRMMICVHDSWIRDAILPTQMGTWEIAGPSIVVLELGQILHRGILAMDNIYVMA